jgi:predicted transcriptional regulator of viral defense system
MKESPLALFRKHGGQLRMSEAIAHGITRHMLYSLRDKGIIEQVSRGAYRLKAGIDYHILDGASVIIYNPEKTLADCFKFRNKIGMDIVIEALKIYRSRQKINLEKLLAFAEVCRIKKIMTPYLDATI